MQNEILFGQYRIDSTIGAGGMAVVYKAYHTSLEKYFAVKKLSDTLSQNGEARERFIREARTHSKLEHPNIVKFHDILQDVATNSVYIVMEYIDGRTLAQMIGRETGPIPFERAYPLFKQILEGIKYAHSMGVVHRDIKPGNILVTKEGVVKILDFGIARDETGHTLTQSGQVVGTLQYASPEQIRGEKVDQRSDIYSLGMTLYEMLAGRLPHDINPNSSSFHIMQRMLTDDVPDPRQFYPHIDENVVKVIFKAINRDVNNRLHSIGDFILSLDGKEIIPEANGIPSFNPPKTARLGEAASSYSPEKIYPEPVREKTASLDAEYERLIQLTKQFPKFFVNRNDYGEIKIINKVDGKQGIRITLMIVAVFFGLAVIGGGFVGLVVVIPSLIYFFRFQFQEEIMIISRDELKISSSKQNFKCNIDNIGSVSYSFKDKGIGIFQKKSIPSNFLFFKNSNSFLSQQAAYILSDIIKKLQK